MHTHGVRHTVKDHIGLYRWTTNWLSGLRIFPGVSHYILTCTTGKTAKYLFVNSAVDQQQPTIKTHDSVLKGIRLGADTG